MNGYYSNDTSLRKLLLSWKCQILAVHIEEEGIDIEELEMMKAEHMTELLRNYRLGIRIRFEHHFEKWRCSINKPIVNSVANYNNTAPFRPTCNGFQNPNENTQMLSKKSVSVGVNTDPVELCTISINPPIPPLVALPPPIIATQKKRKTQEHKDVQQLPQLIPMSPPSSSRCNIKIKNKKSNNSRRMSVMNILKSSGCKGLDVFASYEKNRILTEQDRTTIVNLIAEYFIENNLHISLKTSYALERQILNLFPTEKLRNYRTSRRGRIYVRYYNSKCYRRAKRIIVNSKGTKTHDSLDNNKSNNLLDSNQQLQSCDAPGMIEGFKIKDENDTHDFNTL
ncbi:uncharacterized protein LOC119679384 [Teleopsis dalmanni]|uniref:uncharacterized protein LOC119679384 n=1 Tax=Teleopsis dalmanni TaxID=139649 RepID=UPI0018CCBBA9|nr:uncharacterized protein LOC119679384 [Teleopsis dalmanni]